MKRITTYYISQSPLKIKRIEYDTEEPCRECGKPIKIIGLYRPKTCIWCDGNINRD